MSKARGIQDPPRGEYIGIYENGAIRLTTAVDWPEGTVLVVRTADLRPDCPILSISKIIIAGFGLAGRSVAGLCDQYGIDYVVVERNPKTIQTQQSLGRRTVEGDIAKEDVLRAAGVEEASVLALTVPDEQAVRRAAQLARAINPRLYIIGRSVYASTGMQIEKHGADDVIKVEQLVAREFYEHLLRLLACRRDAGADQPAMDGASDPPGGLRG